MSIGRGILIQRPWRRGRAASSPLSASPAGRSVLSAAAAAQRSSGPRSQNEASQNPPSYRKLTYHRSLLCLIINQLVVESIRTTCRLGIGKELRRFSHDTLDFRIEPAFPVDGGGRRRQRTLDGGVIVARSAAVFERFCSARRRDPGAAWISFGRHPSPLLRERKFRSQGPASTDWHQPASCAEGKARSERVQPRILGYAPSLCSKAGQAVWRGFDREMCGDEQLNGCATPSMCADALELLASALHEHLFDYFQSRPANSLTKIHNCCRLNIWGVI